MRAISRAFTLIRAVGRRIPLPLGRKLGRALGVLAWHVARRERRKALANIAVAYPEWSDIRRREAIRGMFRHLGETLFEVVWLVNLDETTLAKTTVIEGMDEVRKLTGAGRGIVTFTGHCGNWEWLARTVALCGVPVTTMQRERDDAEMNAFILQLREGAGIRTIDRGSATSGREMIQALRRGGGLLAFLIDQNIRAESAKVPFFGKPALTPIGPVKLAIRTGAPIVSMFIRRGDDGMQYVTVNPPFETSRDDDPIAVTARVTREIEEAIRRAPEQWVWMHDRWRERPKWDVSEPPVPPPSPSS
ncbi:MAG TPA: lysophospholipid acyltransferase family protein [Thermoanaerobaculia bacterium]